MISIRPPRPESRGTSVPSNRRVPPHGLALWLLAALSWGSLVYAQASPEGVTVVWSQGRALMPISVFAGVPMIALDDVAHFTEGTLNAGGDSATLSVDGHTATVSTGRSFVPLDGQLVLLSSPSTVRANRWFVPLDFLDKVLPGLSEEKIVYREDTRLLVIGEGFPQLNVRTFPFPAYTRVVLEASAPLPYQVDQTSEQVRVSIPTTYLETGFHEEQVRDGVIEDLVLQRSPEGYLLTVDLGERFGTLKAFELQNPYRMVLDFFRSRVPADAVAATPAVPSPETPQDPTAPGTGEPTATEAEPEDGVLVAPPAPDLPAPPPVSDGEVGTVLTVTLDPGHGGAETGAMGPNGLQEKEVTLAIARQLRDLLEDRLGLRVLLTRDADRELELDERTELANTNGSDLFLSIHANASPRGSAKGSEVYFLSYEASDDESRRVAQAENLGVSRVSAPLNRDLEFILWDMAQTAHLNESADLAETILEELLSDTAESRNRGIKQAPFRVLMGATMPAVLVEVGFITNPEEERLLRSREHQGEVAQALFRGVMRYKERYERRVGLREGTSKRGGQ